MTPGALGACPFRAGDAIGMSVVWMHAARIQQKLGRWIDGEAFGACANQRAAWGFDTAQS